jgi:hypothetical protein
VRYSNRPIYRRRRRIALLIFGVLLLAVLYVFGLEAGGTGGEQTEQVDTPSVEQTTEVTDEQTIAEEEEKTT